jgi:hypothetical protein
MHLLARIAHQRHSAIARIAWRKNAALVWTSCSGDMNGAYVGGS